MSTLPAYNYYIIQEGERQDWRGMELPLVATAVSSNIPTGLLIVG